ncbi:MAG: hypothetical protein GC205_05150 [Bacteroidetes bacterium]|nr:hypothetical protein [Bacteroidota bacterium]
MPTLHAQKPEKSYIRRDHPEGTMYFIEPQAFKAEVRMADGQESSSKGVADFTLDYRDSTASVPSFFTVAFTLPSANALRQVDSAVLVAAGARLGATAVSERYFVEPKGKKWRNRYGARFEPGQGLRWLMGNPELELHLYSPGLVAVMRFGSSEQAIMRALGQVMAIETDLDQ